MPAINQTKDVNKEDDSKVVDVNENQDDSLKVKENEKGNTNRESTRKRIPLGTRNILTAPKRPGFVRRFVNDKDDRIERFKDAGYSIVEGKDASIGDKKIGRATPIGSSANAEVGRGQRTVLMEIPEEYYKEDQAAAQAEIKAVENQIKRRSSTVQKDGLSGEISIS